MAATGETPPGTPSNGAEPDPKHVEPGDLTDEIPPGDAKVDEWEQESFPASDPPQNW